MPDCLGKSTMERQYDIHITPHAEQAMREIASYIAVDLQVPETAMQMLRTFSGGDREAEDDAAENPIDTGRTVA